MTDELIKPHGGHLVNQLLNQTERVKWLDKIDTLPKLKVSSVTASDILCISTGAFSPLRGFLNRDDYQSVCRHMRLTNQTVWSMPIVLPVPRKKVREVESSSHLVLYHPDQQLLAIMKPEDLYSVDLKQEARDVFLTDDPTHPGVQRLYQQSNIYVGGSVWLLNRPDLGLFSKYAADPKMTRQSIAHKQWKSVVGFQTRNPIHRAHEYIQKVALETIDGLLLHPLVGETKSGDLPADIRLKSYQILIKKYYPVKRVLLRVFPAAMRYAGPREAIFHAIVRKNYGCTHFIVGRDHAGVANFYGTYDSQKIFGQFTKEELGITPLFFEHSFYCSACEGMASYKTCPHSEKNHLNLSGTKVREMLQMGQIPPPEFSRPEVIQTLIEGLREREKINQRL